MLVQVTIFDARKVDYGATFLELSKLVGLAKGSLTHAVGSVCLNRLENAAHNGEAFMPSQPI